MEWVLGITALINGLAACFAWAAKLWWAKEYKEATNRIISAKDEAIKAKNAEVQVLERHLKTIEHLNPKTLQEWYVGLSSIAEEYSNQLQIQLIAAHDRIDDLEATENEKTQELDKVKMAYENLKRNHLLLKDEITVNKIPNYATLINSASSSKELADSTSTQPDALKWLNIEDWDKFFLNFSINKNQD